jgi:hypothetical protein
VLVHHIVLALAPGEINPGNAVAVSEGRQPRHEAPAHRGDHRGRGDRLPKVAVKEPEHPFHPLQLRHIQIQLHPVDRLDLEQHVTRHDIGHAAR